MAAVFTADSALMRVLGRFADLVHLNLLFVVTSLPLVTLGGTLPALHHTAMRLVRGRCESVTSEYLRAFRQNLRQGTAVLLVLLGVAAVLGAWYLVVTTLMADGVAQLVLLALWFVAVLQLALMAAFVFPYVATFDDGTGRVLRNARLMSWRHPLTAVVAVALPALAGVITAFYPHLVLYGLVWFAVGFAAIAAVTAVAFVRVFDTYIPAAERPAADSTDGATRAHT